MPASSARDGSLELSERPLFVVGYARSGTSLARSLLCTHPLLQVSPETHFITYWMPRYHGVDLTRRAEFDRFWADFTTHKRFERLQMDPDPVRARILEQGEPTFKSIFTAVLRAHAAKDGKRGWGEKTPNHFMFLRLLFDWYPGARILFLARDPRAVAASWLALDREWTKKPLEQIARGWRNSTYESERWGSDPRVRLARYEDIVRQSEAQLRGIFDFLGLDYPEQELRQRRDTGLRHGSYDIRGPVEAGSLERWREKLSASQLSLVEKITAVEMLRQGYEPETHQPSRLEQARSTLRRRRYRAQRRREEQQQPGARAQGAADEAGD